MGQSAFDLYSQGFMRKKASSPPPFVMQGVVANGTQRLLLPNTGLVDTVDSFFFASVIPTSNGQRALLHYGDTAAVGVYHAARNTSVGQVDPAVAHTYSDGSSTTVGHTNYQSGDELLHIFISTQSDGATGTRCNVATWTATDDFVTSSFLIKSAAANVEFSTHSSGTVYLLKKSANNHEFIGTIYRMAWWVGSSLDAWQTSTHDLFTESGDRTQLRDPAASVATLGDASRVLDAYGNAAVWDSGVFPKGTATAVEGDAFANAA